MSDNENMPDDVRAGIDALMDSVTAAQNGLRAPLPESAQAAEARTLEDLARWGASADCEHGDWSGGGVASEIFSYAQEHVQEFPGHNVALVMSFQDPVQFVTLDAETIKKYRDEARRASRQSAARRRCGHGAPSPERARFIAAIERADRTHPGLYVTVPGEATPFYLPDLITGAE